MPHTSFLVSASHILALLDGTGGRQHSQAYFESHLLSDAAGGTTFTIVPNVARPDTIRNTASDEEPLPFSACKPNQITHI